MFLHLYPGIILLRATVLNPVQPKIDPASEMMLHQWFLQSEGTKISLVKEFLGILELPTDYFVSLLRKRRAEEKRFRFRHATNGVFNAPRNTIVNLPLYKVAQQNLTRKISWFRNISCISDVTAVTIKVETKGWKLKFSRQQYYATPYCICRSDLCQLVVSVTVKSFSAAK